MFSGDTFGQKAYNTSSASCSECGAGVPCKDNLCGKLVCVVCEN